MEFFMVLKSKWPQAAILLAFAVAVGGGGSKTALANLVVQLVGIVLLAVNPQKVRHFVGNAPHVVVFLVAVTLALPLLQSLPLPPAIWRSLPGRELVHEPLVLLGQGDAWFSLSMAIRRTLIAFLSLIPCLALVVLVWDMDEGAKRRVLFWLALMGCGVVLLGAQQLALGNNQLMLFREGVGSSDLQGTFANHNSGGLFLDIALCALIGSVPARTRDAKSLVVAAGVALLLIFGLVLTRSRSSMALICIPAAFFVYRFVLPRFIQKLNVRSVVLGLVGFGVALGAGGLLAAQNQKLVQSFSRFERTDDRRPLIWQDAVVSARHFWPLGAGIGAFDEVFQVDESLENLGAGRAGRAHDDYLEVAVESGLVGLMLLAAWLAFAGLRCVQAFRFGGGVTQAAAAIVILFILQSFIDYPLRNQTLLCVAGIVLAVLAEKPKQSRKAGRKVRQEARVAIGVAERGGA
ncbi:O-antigen ligase family protein [Novosphingobium sp. 1949]|uniref:O-antigen ligase family protein n=1 Tax=Novosphingobium organovorum TaxID=2930092 RepID=A0ABT0BA46_9SPHN|nr:O-antigen ligase family protein [Novosphingobium organovorum]MCJ2181909.1 O-antigen ligase family protein [Novosphingobium organovorum]